MVTLLILSACTGALKDTPSDTNAVTDTSDSKTGADSSGDSETGDSETAESDTQETDTAPSDADGDGFGADVDCNETDATIHPDAAEVPYDGIDQDCDGVDLVDVDGDGGTGSGAGGDDCDDTNPHIYPGAEEWCDAVDHDCDGQPLAAGVCAKVQDLHALALWIPGFEAMTYSTPDLTGDGQPDFLVGGGTGLFPNPYGTLSAGVSLLAGGALPGEMSDGIAVAAYHTWSMDGNACSLGAPPFNAGDVDGDGADDVGMSMIGCDWGIYIERGPFADDGGAEWISDSDYFWTSDYYYYYGEWAHETVTGNDFDGDGRSDLALSFVDFDGLWKFDVFFGGTWGVNPGIRATYEGGSGAHLWKFDDLDGDGLSELGIGDFSIVSGADLAGADGADLADLAYASLELSPEEEKTYRVFQNGWMSPGDWNGDGRADLVAADIYSSSGGDGELLWFDGIVTGEFQPEDALGSVVGDRARGFSNFPYDVARGDFDGDGSWDVLTSGEDFVAILPASRGIPALHTPVDEVALLIGDELVFGHDRLDVSGDAYADLAFLPHDETLGFVLGWDVPWDEAVYW